MVLAEGFWKEGPPPYVLLKHLPFRWAGTKYSLPTFSSRTGSAITPLGDSHVGYLQLSEMVRLGQEGFEDAVLSREDNYKSYWTRFSKLCVGRALGIFGTPDLEMALAVNGRGPGAFRSSSEGAQKGLFMAEYIVTEWLQAIPLDMYMELSKNSKMTVEAIRVGYFQGWVEDGSEVSVKDTKVVVDPRAMAEYIPPNHASHQTWTVLEITRFFMNLGKDILSISQRHRDEISNNLVKKLSKIMCPREKREEE